MLNSHNEIAATRKYFKSGNLQLSYLDFGGKSDQVLVMLHGSMANARTFSELAAKFSDWRVICLDLRGHGWSEHSSDKEYSRDHYVMDILNLIQSELGGQPVTILGHSLGGLNAYQFAARYPELVKTVIVEDIGAEIMDDVSFVDKLPFRSASLKELRDSIKSAGLRAIDYFSESVFEDEQGWGFRTDMEGLKVTASHVDGDWWEDWLSSKCPILLINGGKSIFLDLDQAKRMEARRPNTKLVVFEECGHGVHSDDLNGFYQVVDEFLKKECSL
ncbi:Pimeloyl-ACP methyl ester carboxylesterase [Paenibacillus tianmuensis]|uniref:Pimeloyl-ACP methyl ester carboxylesterase n=1 Tax=Paenibacillus tianmuensis TaxID=624147 RepID=A0A1G4TRB1_9BACL|nr:alpha/beta hydrolase [Paenibacillus tianmuensis]SCW83870.1 Pimeloyl-ACP methyl ester carboxylesterase [Paenibacillus tianmuensis]